MGISFRLFIIKGYILPGLGIISFALHSFAPLLLSLFKKSNGSKLLLSLFTTVMSERGFALFKSVFPTLDFIKKIGEIVEACEHRDIIQVLQH